MYFTLYSSTEYPIFRACGFFQTPLDPSASRAGALRHLVPAPGVVLSAVAELGAHALGHGHGGDAPRHRDDDVARLVVPAASDVDLNGR